MLPRISFYFFLLFGAVLLHDPFIAKADGIITATGGSAGTLVTTALESAGYRMQEIVLYDLNGILSKGAILFFVALVIFAFTSFVINGSYDAAAWIFIGPILFLFLVYTTTLSKSKDWRRTVSDNSEVQAIVGSEPVSRVSWFFHKYNFFISSIYEELIKLLTSDDSKTVMNKFMTRENILSDLLSTRIEDGGLVSLSVETLAVCSRELNAARAVALGARDPVYYETPAYLDSRNFYAASFNKATKTISNSASREYLKELLDGIAAGRATTGAQASPCAIQTAASIRSVGGVDSKLKGAFTCEELWCWMGLGVEREVALNMVSAGKRYGLDPATYEKIGNEIALKLTQPKVQLRYDGQPLNYITPVTPDASLIPVIIGGYLIKEMMEDVNINSGLLPHFSARTGIEAPSFNFSQSLNPDELQEVVRRNQGHQLAESKKYDIFAFAMMLPYVQGIILYGLAVLFPFFCMLAVLPGRLSALFTWLGLWAWVKCWDVGWALVALLENLLWELMPHSSVYEPLKDPNHGPISVFESAFSGDPAYGLSMYFVILASLITSVPLFTAQVMTGAGSGIARHLVSGLSQISQFLGQQMGQRASVQQQMTTDSMRENFWINYVNERLGQVSSANPKSQEHRASIAHLRKQAEQFRKMDNVNMATVLGANLGTRNLGGALDSVISGQNAAIQFEQMANILEAEAVTMDAFANYWEASKQAETTTAESIRAGSSKRRQHWTLPGGGGVATGIANQETQIIMNAKIIGDQARSRIDTGQKVSFLKR